MNTAASPLYIHSLESVLVEKSEKTVIPVTLITAAAYEEYHARASASFSRQMEEAGFVGKDRQVCILRNPEGAVVEIIVGCTFPLSLYTFASISDSLRAQFSSTFLKENTFKLETHLTEKDATNAVIGWGLASYRFYVFRKDQKPIVFPVLIWPDKADRKRATLMVESLCLIKTLINMPANHLGTEELADAAAQVARLGRGTFMRIVDQELIEQNFPMIYEVGKGSPRRPQLVEITWGEDDHPALTLVGKGVVFDTGGLDLKPPPFMLLMKKDMGGSAHVLALAHFIMGMQLPVKLRVLISIAENSVSGESFRPGDVIQSRKGLSVEVSDTDAEGRLVVADALTYACEAEKKPQLLIDFCTLTGSARAALGFDIPAYFTNSEDILEELRKLGTDHEDPVWPLPLHQGYLKEMSSTIADINNIGSGKAGAIHGGLFLEQFIDPSVPWVHIDCYAWEQSGKAGRPQGGADTGMRAVLSLIEKRFSA